jgi:uncharacterized protein (TIGR03437 family)
MRTALLLLLLAGLSGAQSLRPLHVSSAGLIVDDSGKTVVLRGINRDLTGSGNADANATDAEYAAFNQLLSMNLVRIFVNATWWTTNVKVPIANNAAYQDYIDSLIQRAKKYGNYVLIVKAGQFPDPPCGTDGKNCPAAYQGDLNCAANASVCPDQATTGADIDTAFNFWAAFAKKYAADPAVLYDTWEDMHGIDQNTWADNQNQLIAAIRSYSPTALIFVEDTGTAFESIVAGTLSDFAWTNTVWAFHLYAGPTGSCVEPAASPRLASWPQNFDPLVIYAQLHGHAAAITEWGGCNDVDPYHSNIVSYAQSHSVAVAYFDAGLLVQNLQLTAAGTKVKADYAALASGPTGPVLRSSNPVQDAVNNRTQIVAGSWLAVYGTNFADVPPSGKDWSDQDFTKGLPTTVAGVQVLVNNLPAPVWYVFPGQVNFQAPNGISGTATVQVVHNNVASGTATVNVVNTSPGVISYSKDFVTYYPSAQFAGTTNIVGDPAVFGNAVAKAKPGDKIVAYVTGLAPTTCCVLINNPIAFTSPVTITIGSNNVTPITVNQIGAGFWNLGFQVPSGIAAGNYPFTITVNGATSQSGVVLVVGQ